MEKYVLIGVRHWHIVYRIYNIRIHTRTEFIGHSRVSDFTLY